MELIVDIQKKLPGFTLEAAFKSSKEPLGFLGASGSGKSMTLRCIAGLETPTRGRIQLNGKVLFDAEKGINLPSRKRRIGFLFQNYALFPHLTVMENITFALDRQKLRSQATEIKDKIEMFQLSGLEHRYPSQLSGGQQQRVALARALAVEPEALLLDEPFSALDNYLRSQMEKQLIETLENYAGVTLFVTHNIEEAYRVCDNLVVFSKGRITASGNKEDIFSQPPSLETAQLTGCKNMSSIAVIYDDYVEAKEWGINLRIRRKTPGTPQYIGIRAHYLQLVENQEEDNTFPYVVADIAEAPFEVTLYLQLAGSEKNNVQQLQWKIPKEKWLLIKDKPQPWLLRFDPEKLFLMA